MQPTPFCTAFVQDHSSSDTHMTVKTHVAAARAQRVLRKRWRDLGNPHSDMSITIFDLICGCFGDCGYYTVTTALSSLFHACVSPRSKRQVLPT
mmetsp:Transcript_34273/g.53468  ORF Transcript_34273/g.53468 Transcript_34273/m.53468 type:complete len:94 (+) Transcript_34273:644-925(+)